MSLWYERAGVSNFSDLTSVSSGELCGSYETFRVTYRDIDSYMIIGALFVISLSDGRSDESSNYILMGLIWPAGTTASSITNERKRHF